MKKVDDSIKKVLWEFGIRKNYLGFEYLAYILTLTLKDETLTGSISKHLYNNAAKHYSTSILCVERDIRTVITIFWKYGSREFWEKVSESNLHNRPSNGEFICIMTNYLSKNI